MRRKKVIHRHRLDITLPISLINQLDNKILEKKAEGVVPSKANRSHLLEQSLRRYLEFKGEI